jgi:predicted transcriptional regulator
MKPRKKKSLPAPITLGPVETEIMELVWDMGEASVRDIYQVLLSRRQIAYTTVMTILGNLVTKGVLVRRQHGRAYRYSPIVSKDAFIRGRISDIVDNLLNRLADPAITYFAERLAEVDPGRLAELEETIARLRQQKKASDNG